jgi:hypothetical protein
MKRALHLLASSSGCVSSYGFSSRFTSPSFFFLATMLFFAVSAGAQSTANYTFSTNSTGSLALDLNSNAVDMSTGTTQISTSSVDQGVNASAITIGFDFWLMGNRYTQFNATTNGLVSLSSTSTSASGSTYVVSGGTTTTPIISAFAADLGTGTSGKTHYKVVGAAPNRTLVIEFLNMTLYWTTSYTNDGTYQVRLYENTGVVEFVYGAMSITSSGSGSDVTAGIGFATNTTTNNLIYVTSSTNTSSVTASFTDNPTYAAGAIANLNSAANGSRRVYRFTPPVPAAPTSLTFASITATGMTLNWTASSPTTNVLKYAVYNSSDGGTTYNFVNTVTVGTNTLAVTGLSPSTTYLWRVFAVSEGGFSTALTGSQATSAAPTYFWVGTSGADWNTAANWNTAADNTGSTRSAPTNNDVLIVDGAGTTAGAATTISISASQTIGVLRISNSTAVTLQSSAVTTRTITITGGGGDDLDIPSGCSLIMNHASQAVAIAFSTGTGMTGNIAGTLTFGGSTSNTLTTTGGTGTVVTVASTGIVNLGAAGNSLVGSAATLMFANGSNCNSSGATTGAPPVPLATWGATSNLTVTGITSSSTTPTNNAQSFGNLTYNCPSATATMSWFTSGTATVQGNLTISATNTGKFRCVTTGTLTVAGNMVVSGSSICDIASSTGTVNVTGNFTHSSTGTTFIGAGGANTMNVTGAFNVSAGTIDLSSSSSSATLKVAGTFNQTGGAIIESSTSTASTIEFNGSASQSVTLGTVTNTITFRVNNNAGISLTGTMPITTGAGLIISSTAATPISGGTLTYAGTTTLTYNGTGNQTVTSMEFPSSSGPSNLVINNTGTAPANRVNMASTGSRTLSGTFTQTAGVLLLANNDLTVTGTITGTASNTNFVATNGTGQLKKVYAATGSTTFPLGDITGTDEASPATLNYTALTGTSTVGIIVVDAQHPNDLSADNFLSRYWSFTESGASAYTYSLTLNYPATDITGTASSTKLNRYNASTWTQTSSAIPTTTSVAVTGITLAAAPLNASDFTLRPAAIVTYTWKGGASAAYNVSTNWNPTRSTLDATDILTFDGSNIDGVGGTGAITATAVPTETIGRLLLVNNATVGIQSGTAANTLTINGGAGTDLDIPVGSTLNNNGSLSLNIAFGGTGNVASIAGTFQMTGAGHTYSATNSTTTVTGSFTISHTAAGLGGTITSTATNLIFASGSNYNHARDGGSIPTAAFDAASNINITGITSTSVSWPSGTVTAGNLLWNCATQTVNPQTFSSIIATINGTFTLQNTNTGTFQFGTAPIVTIAGASTISGGNYNAAGGTVSFNGGLTQSGGTITGTGTSTLNAASFTQSSGTCTANASIVTLNVTGSVNQSGGTLNGGATGTLNVNFTHASNNQSVTLSGTTSNKVNFSITGAANSITLTGTMAVNTGAGLTVTTTSATPITGGTLTYTGTTTLTYNGAGNQTVNSTVFPGTSGPTNLIINNTGTAPNNRVDLASTGSRTLGGTYTQTAGVFLLANNDLTVTGAISGTASNTNFVATNGTGQLIKIYAATGSTTFPLGDVTGTDEASSATLNYTALTGTSSVGIRVTDAQHPNDASATDFLSRYWSFTESGSSAYTYTLTLNYPSGEVTGTAANTRLNRYNGGTWLLVSGNIPSATSITATGLTLASGTLNASDFTLRPATISTYTWKGGTSAAYNVSTNWNPTRVVPDAGDIMTFDGNDIDGAMGTGAVTVTSVPTETIGQLKLVNNASVAIQAGTAANTLTLSGGTGTDLDIPSGSTLNNNGSLALNIAFSGTGHVAAIAGTFQMTGAGHTYIATNSTTTVTGTFTISHNAANAGGTITSTATNLVFASGGTLIYARDGGTIPTATYNAASTINITGVTATSISWPSGAVTAGNLLWNCAAQTINPQTFLSTLTTITGTFTLQNTNTGTFQFGTSPTVTIAGASTISGGTFNAAGGTVSFNGGLSQSGGTITGTGITTLNVTSFTQSAGTLTANTSTVTLNVSGSLNQSVGATLSGGTTGTLGINFTHASTIQNVTLDGTTSNKVNFGITGAANSLSLSGTMSVNTTASLTITTTAAAPISGGTLVYTGTTTLIYNATTGAQTITANEFPSSSGPSSLTINNTSTSPNNTVTLTADRTISGVLTLTAGIVQEGAFMLTISNTATGGVSGGGASAYVNGPLARVLPASLVSGSTYTFPIGKGSYNLFELVNPTTNAGGTVTVKAEVFDANAGGTAGTNLTGLSTTRYWQASMPSGSANFTSSNVRLTESGLISSNRIGQSATQTGTYASIGGSVSGSTILSNSTSSLNFFVIGSLSGSSIGTYTVCASGCDYTTLTTASGIFTDLNARPFSGNVTIAIMGNLTTEDGATSLNQWTETGAGGYTLSIQPNGGVARTISGSSTTALINLNGADRVTIDGLNTGGNALTISNTSTSGATIRFIADATNNTVQNCTIQGVTTSTTNGVVTISTGTTTGNDNLTISNNLIRDGASAPVNGIYANGTAGASNSSITISNNEIFNWTTNGISVTATGNGDTWAINNNSFYQTASRTATLSAISLFSTGNANTINNNSIGGGNSSRGGTAMTTSSAVTCINLSVGTTTATEVQGNNIGNIVTTSTSTTGFGIQVSAGNVNIGTTSGNTIGGASVNDIQVKNSFDAIVFSSTGTGTINNNTIRNLTYNDVDYERLSGVYVTAGTVTVKDNIIRDFINKGTTTTGASTFYQVGIRLANATSGNLVEGNSIFNLLSDVNSASDLTTPIQMYGISIAGAITNSTITRNRIYNLTTTKTGTSTSAPSIYGIYASTGAATYSNNQISLSQSTASTQPLFRGIQLESTSANNFYYNSVYIDGTAAAANSTHCFYRNSTSGVQTLRNNVFYNERSGSGTHFAIGTASTTGWVASVSSDYSLFIGANASNIGDWAGTANTFATWKTNTSGDTYSWSDLNTNAASANLFTATASGNLNINTANVEAWYVAGKGVQVTGQTTDYGDVAANRSVLVTTGATDIGSDEIGTPAVAPHTATQTGTIAVGNTTTYTFAGRTLASIAWQSGTVPSTLTLKYYSGENPPSVSCSGASKYANAYWDITPDVTSGYTFDLSIGYTPAILGTIPAETDSRLTEKETTCWILYPSSTVNTTTKTVTQTGLTSFSTWTFTDVNAPLPVELTSFKATAVGPVNQLDWTTAAEIDLNRFVVERSSDGINFQPIGQEQAKGASSTYRFDDARPYSVSYYRLRMEDNGGKFEHSSTVVIARAIGTFSIQAIYPSPTSDRANVAFEAPEEGALTLLVTDLTGRLALRLDIDAAKGLNTNELDLSELPAGIYQVNGIFNGTLSKPFRVVKQ